MCQSVTFRDQSSLELVKKYCESERLFVAVDPCFFWKKDNLNGINIEKNIVAINVMDLRLDKATREQQRILLDHFELLIRELIHTTQKKIVLYSTVYEDYHVIRRLAKRLVKKKIYIEVRKVYTISDLSELYQETCYVIAMRMHALILAYSCRIPHYGIAWQKKVESFFEVTKQEKKYANVHDLGNDIQHILSSFVKAQEDGFKELEAKKEIKDLEKVDIRIVCEKRGEENASF